MSLWVTRLLTRLGRWLIRRIRQVQHYVPVWSARLERNSDQKLDMSFCLLLDLVQPSYASFSPERGKQDGHITCLKHINLSGTWWCCWKVDNATLHAGFCLRVGEHERLVTTAEFRRNAIIPRMLLESFDCRSRSNRPCAAKVQNNVCCMVGKIQRSCHHPCSVSLYAEPPSIWSPGIVSPMLGRTIV